MENPDATTRAPDVERAIGYWLVAATRCFAAALTDLLAAHSAERGKPYAITPPQWGLIAQLSANGSQTIGELARHLGVDGPAITNLVKRLEVIGLVKRVRSKADERIVQVSLTDEGTDLFHSVAPVVERFQQQTLPDSARERLVAGLKFLVERLSVVAPESTERERFDVLRALIREQSTTRPRRENPRHGQSRDRAGRRDQNVRHVQGGRQSVTDRTPG